MAFAKIKPNQGGGSATPLFKPKGSNKVVPTDSNIFVDTGFEDAPTIMLNNKTNI